MAYVKVFAVRQRLDKTIRYATNGEKTSSLQLENSQKGAIDYALNSEKTVPSYFGTALNLENEIADDPFHSNGAEVAFFETSINLEHVDTAYESMIATKNKFCKTDGVLGYHFIQSFKPGETTPELAHQIGVELATELFGDKYEVVVGTHLDKAHLHNHIVMNSVSFVDGKKYHSNHKTYYNDLRGTSDRLCQKYGLSVIKANGKGVHYAEHAAEQQGKPTIREMVRQDIDDILLGCHTMEKFWSQLKEKGYRVTRKGENMKHTSIRPTFGKRNIRLDSLGADYTEEGLKERLYYYRRGLTPPTALEKAQNVTSGEKPTSFTTRTPLYYRAKRYRVWIKRSYPKAKGLQALYRHYLFLLGKVQYNKARPVINATLRGEVLKFEQYQKQTKLLRYYNIQTEEELTLLEDALETSIDSLEGMRKSLYTEKRKENSPEKREQIECEISRLTRELQTLRVQRTLCKKICESKPQVLEQVKFANKVVEEEKELQEQKDKTKNHNKRR